MTERDLTGMTLDQVPRERLPELVGRDVRFNDATAWPWNAPKLLVVNCGLVDMTALVDGEVEREPTWLLIVTPGGRDWHDTRTIDSSWDDLRRIEVL